MERLKIGVIGAGRMGFNHIRNLSEEKRFDLIGIYDANEERVNEIAEAFGITGFCSMEDLLESVDAVIVAVPSSLHKEVGLMVAHHNVHALIEKPLATNAKDAKEIEEAFREKGLVLRVGHVERFNPVIRELGKIIKNEKILFVEAKRFSPFSISGRIGDVSVVEDLMIHDIDLVCNLIPHNEIKEIKGFGAKVKSNYTDVATGVISFDKDSYAIVSASRVSQNKERTIIVHMENQCVLADLLAKTLIVSKNTDLTIDLKNDNSYKQAGTVEKVFVPIQEPLREEQIAFYNSVVKGETEGTNGKDGIRAIKICEEIVKQIN